MPNLEVNSVLANPVESNNVSIIGCGSVGIAIASALGQRNLGLTLHMVDIDTKVLEGQVLDLEDSFSSTSTEIRAATLQEAGQSQIIIVTAGAKQKPNESRDQLVDRNTAILKSILDGMGRFNRNSIWLVVANPVDQLTCLTQRLTGLPFNQVLGTGTLLDSIRLRVIIAKRLGIDAGSINLNVIGCHGDDQIANWSSATINGFLPLLKHPKMLNLNKEALNHLAYQAAYKAYEIINLKGYTNFGIGSAVANICQQIIYNSKTILPITCYHPKFNVYMSFPAVLDNSGIKEVITDVGLDSDERTKLEEVVNNLKQFKELLE